MGEYRRTVEDLKAPKGTYVMVRSGLDVPLDQKFELLDPKRVTDDTRIIDILPTLYTLIDKGYKIILAAGWCGRPKGEDPDYDNVFPTFPDPDVLHNQPQDERADTIKRDFVLMLQR